MTSDILKKGTFKIILKWSLVDINNFALQRLHIYKILSLRATDSQLKCLSSVLW